MSVLTDIDSADDTIVGPNPPVVQGVVQGDPATMANQAGLSLDTYALARMVASEQGSRAAQYLLAVAECAINRAKRVGKSVGAMLLIGKSSSGKFGQTATGKWASTARPATRRSLAAAQAALAGSNFALGGRDFIEPAGMIPGRQEGVGTVHQSAKDYIDSRAKEGLVWVGDLPGIDPSKLMIFADKSAVKTPDENIARSENYTNVPGIVAFLLLVTTVSLTLIATGKIG